MIRWNTEKRKEVENKKIDDFLNEVIDVCKKHGFSIRHEDYQGAFEIYNFDDGDESWIMHAHDCTKETMPF